MKQQEKINGVDKKIVQVLQEDFPLVSEPYKLLAERIGMTEEDFLKRIEFLKKEKCIRKMGAVLQHREVGYTSNALCAWEVPESRMDEAAAMMSASPNVSHCYDRETAPGWPYNLYTMVHGHSKEECETVIRNLSRQTQVTEYVILYTKKEWKKTSMQYFKEK